MGTREKLIKQCRYYNGEESNPWTMCCGERLEMRRRYWQVEKDWVDALTKSFDAAKHERINALHLSDYCLENSCPRSLMERVVNFPRLRSIQNASNAVVAIENYLECAPLGHGVERYFSYYNGEKHNPYNETGGDAGLFWMQEEIVYSNSQCGFFNDWVNQGYVGTYRVDPVDEPLSEGAEAWMHDDRYPIEQRALWCFIATNYLSHNPYANGSIEEMGENYIGFHYKK